MNILEKFKVLMAENKIDAYIVPTSDYHLSEYTANYFKTRAFLSGFSGSAGTLLVIRKKAYLWTDGRYFIQAQKEIEEFGIKLMKMGSKDKSLEDFLSDNLKEGDTLGFDGKTMPTTLFLNINKKLSGVNYVFDKDLVDSVWNKRPKLPSNKIYTLPLSLTGLSRTSKIALVREKLKEKDVSYFVLSALEDIAWLFNMRGSDIKNTPVFLAYAVITNKEVNLFLNKESLNKEATELLYKDKINVIDYNYFYTFLKDIKKETVLIDKNKTNYLTYSTLKENNSLLLEENITLLLKAKKNKIEIENTKKAHFNDGLVMTKFMYYLKHNSPPRTPRRFALHREKTKQYYKLII